MGTLEMCANRPVVSVGQIQSTARMLAAPLYHEVGRLGYIQCLVSCLYGYREQQSYGWPL